MKYNNIYDRLCKEITEYKTKYGFKPKCVLLGKNLYDEWMFFIVKFGFNMEKVCGCDIFLDKSIHKDCLIVNGIEMEGVTSDNKKSKLCVTDKEKFISNLLELDDELYEKTKESSIKLSDEIDEDIKYLHNEILFEKYYKNRENK